jgi:hypothetical protein
MNKRNLAIASICGIGMQIVISSMSIASPPFSDDRDLPPPLKERLRDRDYSDLPPPLRDRDYSDLPPPLRERDRHYSGRDRDRIRDVAQDDRERIQDRIQRARDRIQDQDYRDRDEKVPSFLRR